MDEDEEKPRAMVGSLKERRVKGGGRGEGRGKDLQK